VKTPDGALYIGIMSGTSADGVDVVLVDLSGSTPCQLGTRYHPFTPELRRRILRLQSPMQGELHESALVSIELARAYAECANALLREVGIGAGEVRAIGCHGQTVRHRPEAGYSVQLVNGALLAELTDICVVCDLRSRDIAAGGQGAPLVPAFHDAVFADPGRHRVIANIGGIANITDLPRAGEVHGFDTGPGNVLLDAWAERHLGTPHDEDGRWAKSGRVVPQLLQALLDHPFFARKPPKSTGREEFNLEWLQSETAGADRPADVQATLVALTAVSIADAVRAHYPGATELYVCGGGAHNSALMAALGRSLGNLPVHPTDQLGIPADWVEASAFAWLARRALLGESGNLPAVTGAKGPRVLGAIYPA
jgi:anhydro-N-acetylmuramic acid kinase